MRKKVLLVIVLIAISFLSKSQLSGSVDSTSAKNIIIPAWQVRFGNIINEATPYVAQAQGDSVWIIKGTLKGNNGGVPYGRVRRSDGKIIEMYWKGRE